MARKWYLVKVTRVNQYMVEVDPEEGLSATDFIMDELSHAEDITGMTEGELTGETLEVSLKFCDKDKIYPAPEDEQDD